MRAITAATAVIMVITEITAVIMVAAITMTSRKIRRTAHAPRYYLRNGAMRPMAKA